MISEKELLEAIDKCKNNVNSFQWCEKLAALYTAYDHLYGQPVEYANIRTETETIVEVDGDNDFLKAVNGKNAVKIWNIMSELMESVKLIQPKLYNAVMRKISEN